MTYLLSLKEKPMQINFLSVGCGDGISIRFLGNDGMYHNILIDGGVEPGQIYVNTIKKEIKSIVDRKETIDLWIISHIDDDHIGGILNFLNDKELIPKVNLSNTEFWFNYSNWDYETAIATNRKSTLSVPQGIRLRNFLRSSSKLYEVITANPNPKDIHGAKVTLISPNKAKFEKLVDKWKKEETKIRQKTNFKLINALQNDYSTRIEDFDLSEFKEDDSEENGSSIAFILEYNSKKIMFLADSHPSVIAESLSSLGYSKSNKLMLDYMQIAHHGSKFNNSDKPLEMIECSNFIISGDAVNKHRLPNKETLARFVKHFSRPINFYITHENPQTKSIFKVDGFPKDIIVHYPLNNSNAISIDL